MLPCSSSLQKLNDLQSHSIISRENVLISLLLKQVPAIFKAAVFFYLCRDRVRLLDREETKERSVIQ